MKHEIAPMPDIPPATLLAQAIQVACLPPQIANKFRFARTDYAAPGLCPHYVYQTIRGSNLLRLTGRENEATAANAIAQALDG